jgi:hypothetical protein
MNLEAYAQHLSGLGIPEEGVKNQSALIRDFESMGGMNLRAAGKTEAEKFARRLIAEGRNTIENFSALGDYAGWAGLRALHVAWIELMDCHNALEALAAEIERRHGKDMREKIFAEPLPPLGADETKRSAYTLEVAGRMGRRMTVDQARQAWFQVQHGIPAEAWRKNDAVGAALFGKYGDIDRFLEAKRAQRDALLTHLRDEDKLWYTVKISDAVLAFVKSDPEMEVGRREGENIYISKIPYNAERYLAESDPRIKRYYACHCPLVRQALLDGRPVAPEVCHCSLGHASHYLAGIGGSYRGEVLESAVRGDLRCRFVFRPA